MVAHTCSTCDKELLLVGSSSHIELSTASKLLLTFKSCHKYRGIYNWDSLTTLVKCVCVCVCVCVCFVPSPGKFSHSDVCHLVAMVPRKDNGTEQRTLYLILTQLVVSSCVHSHS